MRPTSPLLDLLDRIPATLDVDDSLAGLTAVEWADLGRALDGIRQIIVAARDRQARPTAPRRPALTLVADNKRRERSAG